jgi:hypothetical protein
MTAGSTKGSTGVVRRLVPNTSSSSFVGTHIGDGLWVSSRRARPSLIKTINAARSLRPVSNRCYWRFLSTTPIIKVLEHILQDSRNAVGILIKALTLHSHSPFFHKNARDPASRSLNGSAAHIFYRAPNGADGSVSEPRNHH